MTRAGEGLPPKPAYGDPCNGCGLCCIIAQCPISTALFGEQEVCPALEQCGNSLGCGLMISTANYVPDLSAWGGKTLTEAFTLMIGSGIGCDSTMGGEEIVQSARDAILAKARQKIADASPDARALIEYFRA